MLCVRCTLWQRLGISGFGAFFLDSCVLFGWVDMVKLWLFCFLVQTAKLGSFRAKLVSLSAAAFAVAAFLQLSDCYLV